ncbi:hypothetical protein M514_07324 [Trichuris suis]|uniref:Uncharacterized protein n=1 Tax=Trichuris suis TaxID=68888 RepID=A0A085NFU3_9BILA|nr:hypothetical protein M514_07324 [Trichuris suis]
MVVKSARFNTICDVIYKCLKSRAEIKVSYKACKHIWLKHGCYENAKFYFASRQGKGRMPSHYFDHCTLIQAIVETLDSPHVTKWRPLKCSQKCDGAANPFAFNKSLGRLLYLKEFLFPIGRAGLITPNSQNGKELSCCGVVVDVHKGLVTSYPAESFNDFKDHSGSPRNTRGFP